MIQEKLVTKVLYHQLYTPLTVVLGIAFTEGQKREIMFFLGAAAALCTIAARLIDIYIKFKNKEKNKEENKL